ncbi:MAG TPA: caspase family protein, partial [Candidatus Angelobacter sp.]|nr:caspase family protein [Candidatus Angelobacter sp.]
SLVVSALKGEAADLFGHVTASSIYTYLDQALTVWDQRPMFKANVTSFTPLRSVAPAVPLEVLRRICRYFPAPKDEHLLDPSYEFTDPSNRPGNVAIMKDLQKFESAGLVVPVGAEHMYFAAMNSKACRLTPLGCQYWKLVKADRI